MQPQKTRLTTAEAKEKWGALKHAPTDTYLHFPEVGGAWRPEVRDGELVHYSWHEIREGAKTHRWRRR